MGLRAALRRFSADQSGATAIEYALICGIMMLAVISIAATGGALDAIYEKLREIIDAVDNAGGGGGGGGGGG